MDDALINKYKDGKFRKIFLFLFFVQLFAEIIEVILPYGAFVGS